MMSPTATRDVDSIRIHPITGWRSLFPLSHTCTPFGLPCGLLTRFLTREIQACPVPRN
ncbi:MULTISPECIES: hypothetical protein [Bacteroidaceae]|uniref:hypothetical protein n=1 Tax=Bacteroidaceae TaxID=815 RepID=UPI0013A60AF3|nr:MULTISPECIES: hypothetical protein [Bacteroidaceae]